MFGARGSCDHGAACWRRLGQGTERTERMNDLKTRPVCTIKNMYIHPSSSRLYILTACMCIALTKLCMSLFPPRLQQQSSTPHQLNINHHTKNPPTPKTPSLMQLTSVSLFPFSPSVHLLLSYHPHHHRAQANHKTTLKRSPP
jgi:hypothetical protein